MNNNMHTIKLTPASLYAYSDALANAAGYQIGPKTSYAIMRNVRFVGKCIQSLREEVIGIMEAHGAKKNPDGSFMQQIDGRGMATPVFALPESLDEYNAAINKFNNERLVELPVYQVLDAEVKNMVNPIPAAVLLGLEPMLIFEDENNSNDDLHPNKPVAESADSPESDHRPEQPGSGGDSELVLHGADE